MSRLTEKDKDIREPVLRLLTIGRARRTHQSESFLRFTWLPGRLGRTLGCSLMNEVEGAQADSVWSQQAGALATTTEATKCQSGSMKTSVYSIKLPASLARHQRAWQSADS